MKSVQLLSLTPAGNFLVLEGNKVSEATFEGLIFNKTLSARQFVRQVINKTFECKISKSANKIRYGNLQFFEEAIKINAATLNIQQIEESKLFTAEEKQRLNQCQIDDQKMKQMQKKLVDYGKDRKKLLQLYAKTKNIEARVEFLIDEFYFSFLVQNQIHYVPIKLRNIEHYFELVEQSKFGKFISQNKSVQIKLDSCKFNLSKSQYQIQAILPEKLEKIILQEGWGTVSLKNIHRINPQTFNQYRKLEQQAKNSHKGIFAKPFQILSLVYTKNNLVAAVQEIIEGYIFKIRTKNDESIKIELAKIHCPLGNQIGAFACRQFARKNLIGKEVNIFLTKDEGLNILGSVVRFVDNKDIQTLMIQNGYGFVKQELKGTMFYAKLQSLQKKAKQLRRGIHDEKSVSLNQFYQDFTAGYNKKEKIDKKNLMQSKHNFLRVTLPGDEGIIEKCVDPITYIVRVDSHKKLLRVKLDGVAKILANPRLPEMIELQKASEKYLQRNFFQRTVSIELTQFNEVSNSFIGVLRYTNKGKQKVSFQQALLNQGLVILTNHGFFQDKWIQCQKGAKSKKIGCWTDKLSHFVRNDILEQQQHQFYGKFSWIQDGQIAYVQPSSVNDKLDTVYSLLSNKEELKPVKQEDLIAGYLCAALYQQQMCRARIVSVDGNNVMVKFVDWGNKEIVPLQAIREIPNQLQYIPALCCEVELDLVRPLKGKDPQHMQKLREYLMEFDCKFVKSYSNIVNAYAGQTHLNTNLIYEGYLKADLSKIVEEEVKKHLMSQMDKLRKELVGVWDLQENNSDIQDDYL